MCDPGAGGAGVMSIPHLRERPEPDAGWHGWGWLGLLLAELLLVLLALA